MLDLYRKRVLLLGHTGFLGRHVLDELEKYEPILLVNEPRADLRCLGECRALFARHLPEVVVNLTGKNGGLAYNLTHHGSILLENSLINSVILTCCSEHGVRNVLSVVASCAYPGERTVLREKDFLDGPPHPSVAGHAEAKRHLCLSSRYFSGESGVRAVCVCPTTLYGPGMPYGHNAKVLGGLLDKLVNARLADAPRVTLWGTGAPKRELLHVRDCARLLVQALCLYEDTSLPLNLGSGQEHSVKKLALMVSDAVGYRGEVRWDTSMPDGQPRKLLNCERMFDLLGPQKFVPLEEGLRECVQDHENRFPRQQPVQ